jgi:hypothetical protein
VEVDRQYSSVNKAESPTVLHTKRFLILGEKALRQGSHGFYPSYERLPISIHSVKAKAAVARSFLPV